MQLFDHEASTEGGGEKAENGKGEEKTKKMKK